MLCYFSHVVLLQSCCVTSVMLLLQSCCVTSVMLCYFSHVVLLQSCCVTSGMLCYFSDVCVTSDLSPVVSAVPVQSLLGGVCVGLRVCVGSTGVVCVWSVWQGQGRMWSQRRFGRQRELPAELLGRVGVQGAEQGRRRRRHGDGQVRGGQALGGGSLRLIGCWSSEDEDEEVGVLKSRGTPPPLPLTILVSLTMAPSDTAEEGGVSAGRPLSDEESSGDKEFRLSEDTFCVCVRLHEHGEQRTLTCHTRVTHTSHTRHTRHTHVTHVTHMSHTRHTRDTGQLQTAACLHEAGTLTYRRLCAI